MKLHNLQILRGISALLVCCFHFRADLNFNAHHWGDTLFSKGSIGVPIFFVISGYIMVFSTRKITNDNLLHNVATFAKKRIIRIVPLYYLLTFAWIVLGGSVLYYLERNPSIRLLNSLLFLPQKDQFPVLFLGWSLNYEIFFYLIFAISFLFRKYRYVAVIVFFGVAMLIGWYFAPENAFLKMVTDFLNIYFIAGILLGLFLHKIRAGKNFLTVFSYFSILLFIFYFLNVISTSSQILAVIPVFLLVTAFLVFDLFLKMKANSFLKMLGDISYSIYLSHPFVEILFRRFPVDSAGLLILFFIIKLAVVILVSRILYELIEKRLTLYLKLKLSKPTT
ncbi:MAG: acyltransferase family protein [Kaistella sp.]